MALKQTPAEAALRRDKVLSAATDVFFRYGHARTTMGDIAEKAGLSRPALYLVFPNKEDVFAAVIERMMGETLARWRAALPKLRTLDKKLHYCCAEWAIEGWELTHAHPDARDVFDLAFPPVRKMYDDLETFLVEIARDAVLASKLDTTPADLVRVLVFSMRGFKEIARSAAHMRKLVTLHVDLVLAGLARSK